MAPPRASATTGRSATRRSTSGPVPRRSGRSCATSPAARRTPPRRRRCGTSPSRPPWPRPSWRTGSCPGAYHRVAFHRADGDRCSIETTRPELLPACVALVAHPDDERYASSVGTTVTHPGVRGRGAGLAHPLAEPDKGTGIAMVLHVRRPHRRAPGGGSCSCRPGSVIGRDGRLLAETARLDRRRRRRDVRPAGRARRSQARDAVVDAAARARRPASASPSRPSAR